MTELADQLVKTLALSKAGNTVYISESLIRLVFNIDYSIDYQGYTFRIVPVNGDVLWVECNYFGRAFRTLEQFFKLSEYYFSESSNLVVVDNETGIQVLQFTDNGLYKTVAITK